jgi:hypothetical protein
MNFPERVENISAKKSELYFIFSIVALNFILKAVPAGILELGNDEVYYWTYALFPDWSHFDHPPMVGLLIQLFSLNLSFHGDFFIRLGSLILSSGNIIILFYLVKRIYSPLAGYLAILMYISSFYFNIISGLFILPDSPMIFFTLLALFFGINSFTSLNPARKDNLNIILFGLFTGLAFLSKYHALFLWFGAGMFILFHNRIWLRKPALYISVIITLILMIPVVYWNYNNEFISFTFHGNRVGLFHNKINLNYFLQFSMGQFFYQNPVLSVIYLLALLQLFFRKRPGGISKVNILLLYTGLPLILLFTLFSVFRSALPHWTGPAFLCLIILSSEYLAEIYSANARKTVRILCSSLGLYLIILIAGTLQINFGLINTANEADPFRTGKSDFTLDMYGWEQAGSKFSRFLVKEGIPENEHAKVKVLSDNWFPAAHIDYYIAGPLNIQLIAFGKIERIHKYYWINKTRVLKQNDRIFYVTDSRNFHDPEAFASCFSKIVHTGTLPIERNNRIVKYIYIYDMIGFKCDSILNSPHPGF